MPYFSKEELLEIKLYFLCRTQEFCGRKMNYVYEKLKSEGIECRAVLVDGKEKLINGVLKRTGLNFVVEKGIILKYYSYIPYRFL